MKSRCGDGVGDDLVEKMTTDDKKKKKNSILVRVGNLPPETRNTDLRKLFQPFGVINSAHVGIQQGSCFNNRWAILEGRFGFVNFVDNNDAQRAIEALNGSDFQCFVLRVEYSTPIKENVDTTVSSDNDDSRPLHRPIPCCCHTPDNQICRLRYKLSPPQTVAGMFVFPCFKAFVEEMTTGSSDDKKKNSAQVVVGNLPFETRNPDLLQLFEPFGHVISADVAFDQNTGYSNRFGFVNFATKEAAQSAIERLNGIDYHNFVLRVEWPTQKQPKY
jgi:RNA recognition motif-containing protein